MSEQQMDALYAAVMAADAKLREHGMQDCLCVLVVDDDARIQIAASDPDARKALGALINAQLVMQDAIASRAELN